MTIEAKVILNSVGRSSPRLTTFLLRYPKFIHAEHCRHRTMSLCVSSSRAVPVSKNLEEVRSDELRAAPVWWGKEQKGMSAAEELDDEFNFVGGVVLRSRPLPSAGRFGSIDPYPGRTQKATAEIEWRASALRAADSAEFLSRSGVHKSIVNRVLEPYLHVNVLCTVTEPGLMNFFGLRLDKAAQPEIRTLAEQMWKCWNESTPRLLVPGQWHLPFVDTEDWDILNIGKPIPECGPGFVFDHSAIKVSVARCARLSYTSFETGKRSTIEEDLALYDRLITSRPIHASPAEHQATPDNWAELFGVDQEASGWQHKEQAGNLGPGWRQYRKMLPGESVAPLPEGHRIKSKNEPC